LSQLGCRTKRAASADAALAMPLSNVDLVFTDVLMPGSMDGIALAEELSRRVPGLPVLLTSGYAGVPDRVARAGFTLLRKPHDSEQLRQAIGMALSKDRQP
jgi:CheY-like chemotaxis protein